MNKIKETALNLSPFNNRTEMPKLLYIIKVVLIFYLFKFGGEVVCEGLALGIHFACGLNPLQGEMFDMETITMITYVGYSVMISLILLFWRLFQKKTPVEMGFTGKVGHYLAALPAGALLIVACIVPVLLTGTLQYNGIVTNIDTKMVLLMIPCYIFQGAVEEVLCRGVVQQLLIKKVSVPAAFAGSAAMFIIPHIDNMSGAAPEIYVIAVINLILISLLFSLVTYRSGSIWAACALHSVWNYILNIIFGLNVSGNEESVAAVFNVSSVGNNILTGTSETTVSPKNSASRAQVAVIIRAYLLNIIAPIS